MMMMMMMSELARQCRMACFSHEMLTPQNSNVLVLAWAPPVGPALEDKTTGSVVTFRPCSASPQGLICRNIVAPLGGVEAHDGGVGHAALQHGMGLYPASCRGSCEHPCSKGSPRTPSWEALWPSRTEGKPRLQPKGGLPGSPLHRPYVRMGALVRPSPKNLGGP